VHHPERFGDRSWIERPIFSELVEIIAKPGFYLITIDDAVDYQMRHVHALWTILAGECLSEVSESALCGGEMSEIGLTAKRRGRTL
jgi:hypothetical protein